uniref:Uncharacterized protein n=1 Tax=Panagrolaimus sp. JU765 TaxID=591449 RepID=A0AC34RBY7_9BILA
MFQIRVEMNILTISALLSTFLVSAFADISPPDSAAFLDVAAVCEQLPHLPECQDQLPLMEKRKSAYMRFGRSAPSDGFLDAMEKRKSAYMRFGKRSGPTESDAEIPQELEKRKSAYMRFGKRKSAYMRFGKRADEGFDSAFSGDAEKRKSAYMRFGR